MPNAADQPKIPEIVVNDSFAFTSHDVVLAYILIRDQNGERRRMPLVKTKHGGYMTR